MVLGTVSSSLGAVSYEHSPFCSWPVFFSSFKGSALWPLSRGVIVLGIPTSLTVYLFKAQRWLLLLVTSDSTSQTDISYLHWFGHKSKLLSELLQPSNEPCLPSDSSPAFSCPRPFPSVRNVLPHKNLGARLFPNWDPQWHPLFSSSKNTAHSLCLTSRSPGRAEPSASSVSHCISSFTPKSQRTLPSTLPTLSLTKHEERTELLFLGRSVF